MIEQWYEVRADYEQVAAFAPATKDMEDANALEESLEHARKVVEATRSDLYRDKVLQIVECKQNTENPLVASRVIYETHPTVFEEGSGKPLYKVSASIKEAFGD